MTWILPKQLHTLASALDTEALISDLNEQSHICAQSLLLRSKPSPARIWSRKWKRDSWTQHLSGRILKPSLGESFTDAWTSLVAVTRVNLSAPPANDSEQTTRDISGPSSQLELLPCDQDFASSRTSKGTFLWDSSKSYETFKDLVIAARSEYSARLKSARRISESGSSSWPTAQARDWKDCGPTQGNRTTPNLGTAVHDPILADRDSRSSPGSRPELWPTATAVNRVRDEETLAKCAAFRKRNANQNTVPLYLEEKVRIEEAKQWPTPIAGDWKGQVPADREPRMLSGIVEKQAKQWPTATVNDSMGSQYAYAGGDPTKPVLKLPGAVQQWATPNVPNGGRSTMGSADKQTKIQVMLHHQVQSWATPIVGDSHLASTPEVAAKRLSEGKVTLSRQNAGKLNPRWVETLMGLPVGWTMPSCASPVTPEWTSSDFSATASCQQQPSEPLTS